MNSSKTQRKTIYVNSRIQGRVLAHVVMYWFVYHVVLWHAMFVYRYMQYRGELLAGAPPVPFRELYGDFILQHYSMVVCAVAVLPLLMWDLLRLTHRIAGPLVRFGHALQALARGEQVEKIRLRQGDLLSDFRDVFNEYLGSVYGPGSSRELREADVAPCSDSQATSESASDSGEDEDERILEDLNEIRATFGKLKPSAPTREAAIDGARERTGAEA